MVRALTFLLIGSMIWGASVNTAGAQAKSGKPTAISADLLKIYQETKTATAEADVTRIARSCAQVVPDKKRTEADREYASSLLAWALNRRGEMRTAAAAKLVDHGDLKGADALDQKALEDYQTAIEYAPTNWRMHHNLAISLAMKGQYTNAIEGFNTVIGLKSDYANAYFNRAELYFELKQFAEAISDYNRAIEIAPTDPQYFNSRGHCRFILESYDEALADYRKAVEQGPDSAVYQTDLADALQFLGKWQEAAESYRKAVATNDRYARAYMNAAWLMATCPDKRYRNTELALSAAKKAAELEGTPSVRCLDTLAAAHAAAGKLSDAVAHQQRAVQQAPADERDELQQRLAIYKQGKPYVQPASVNPVLPLDSGASTAVRTASDSVSIQFNR